MRLGEQTQARDAASIRKLMPLRRTDRAQVHRGNDPLEQLVEERGIAQRLSRTAVRVNDPFDSAHGVWDYG
jgi:hypothetical protein